MDYDVTQIKDDTKLLIFNISKNSPIEQSERFAEELEEALSNYDINVGYVVLQGADVITDGDLPSADNLKEFIIDASKDENMILND
jgi:hypothetical protein